MILEYDTNKDYINIYDVKRVSLTRKELRIYFIDGETWAINKSDYGATRADLRYDIDKLFDQITGELEKRDGDREEEKYYSEIRKSNTRGE